MGSGAKKNRSAKKLKLSPVPLYFSSLSLLRTALHYLNAWNRLSSVVLITPLVTGNNAQSIKRATKRLLTKFLATGKMKVKLFSEIQCIPLIKRF